MLSLHRSIVAFLLAAGPSEVATISIAVSNAPTAVYAALHRHMDFVWVAGPGHWIWDLHPYARCVLDPTFRVAQARQARSEAAALCLVSPPDAAHPIRPCLVRCGRSWVTRTGELVAVAAIRELGEASIPDIASWAGVGYPTAAYWVGSAGKRLSCRDGGARGRIYRLAAVAHA